MQELKLSLESSRALGQVHEESCSSMHGLSRVILNIVPEEYCSRINIRNVSSGDHWCFARSSKRTTMVVQVLAIGLLVIHGAFGQSTGIAGSKNVEMRWVFLAKVVVLVGNFYYFQCRIDSTSSDCWWRIVKCRIWGRWSFCPGRFCPGFGLYLQFNQHDSSPGESMPEQGLRNC